MNNRSNTVQVSLLSKEVALRYILDYLDLDFCTVRDRYKSGLPFSFLFHKGDLRYCEDYKKFKKDNNISVKKTGRSLGEGIMKDTDENKEFENKFGESILEYIDTLERAGELNEVDLDE